jgi:hypothetical protein
MPDAAIVDGIYIKWSVLVEDLDERGRRRWAATEAISLGRGGIAAVSEATGMSDRTIRSGIAEVKAGAVLPKGYQRAKGGGRKSLEYHQPDIVKVIESLNLIELLRCILWLLVGWRERLEWHASGREGRVGILANLHQRWAGYFFARCASS